MNFSLGIVLYSIVNQVENDEDDFAGYLFIEMPVKIPQTGEQNIICVIMTTMMMMI
jgi:hypothetical protein